MCPGIDDKHLWNCTGGMKTILPKDILTTGVFDDEEKEDDGCGGGDCEGHTFFLFLSFYIIFNLIKVLVPCRWDIVMLDEAFASG